ncbi:hypothetical protein PanWU01x14_065430 [Parasponia andersonii]|uniref:Uncharacterized protein n=1 Tax=Parasponia andersonii TaxID=3476 RepID=A0A2P5DGT4_PARAD|nr:hypothetical protein PanWU01x14_065430 [Parasponia andersonii]
MQDAPTRRDQKAPTNQHRVLPPLVGEIAARSSIHHIRKSAAVLPSDIRSPHHHYQVFALSENFCLIFGRDTFIVEKYSH